MCTVVRIEIGVYALSRWGHQNFESDNALDVLGNWLRRIVSEIDQTINDDSELSTLYDEDGDAFVIANVELLCVLCETYDVRPQLTHSRLDVWKRRYLAAFDQRETEDQIDRVNADKRRKIIVATFDRLNRVIS
jgi:hypothetical protein